MGMELLRQQAAKQGVAIEVSKEPLETVFYQGDNLRSDS